MRDTECVAFLQWALPRLNMRWPGFRKVRRQVCKRVARRMKELGLERVDQYREILDTESDEWKLLDAACRITISRFYRDKNVFDILGRDVLPALAEKADEESRSVRCWCAGCASGEEAYTLAILSDKVISQACSTAKLEIFATDADPHMIARAKDACFSPGSLKDVPSNWLAEAFTTNGLEYCVKPRFRRTVTILLQDIRREMPDGPFDLVLCRNLVLTYFETSLQSKILTAITERLRPEGYLVIGAHETLPAGEFELEALDDCHEILRRGSDSKASPHIKDQAGIQSGRATLDLRQVKHDD